jgi:5-methylcytosine-specific restriction enzyme subunit McrC
MSNSRNDKGKLRIPTETLYYILNYYFENKPKEEFREDIGTEDLEKSGNQFDYFAEILENWISRQLKKGLFQSYIDITEDLYTVRGKICMTQTIRNRINQRSSIVCEHDEYSANVLLNQIVKKALYLLIQKKDLFIIDEDRRNRLRKLYFKLSSVSDLSDKKIEWNRLDYSKSNVEYRAIVKICRLIIEREIWIRIKGKDKKEVYDKGVKNDYDLFEKFILMFCKKHQKIFENAGLTNIEIKSDPHHWVNESGEHTKRTLLPGLCTDITIKAETSKGVMKKHLIIETKFHSDIYTHRKDAPYPPTQVDRIFYSEPINQLFVYMYNLKEHEKKSGMEVSVSGLLLYGLGHVSMDPEDPESNQVARNAWIWPGNEQKPIPFQLGEFPVTVGCLDLIRSFRDVKVQLEYLIKEAYGLGNS